MKIVSYDKFILNNRLLMKIILIPLPHKDFDPSETAIPFKLLKEKNYSIVFSTPMGVEAAADPIMLTGKGLGILKRFFMARKDAIDAYAQMMISPEFKNPIAYSELKTENYDALLLPGGHAKGMREYLESSTLQNVAAEFMNQKKLVAAVCHGVVLLARSKGADGKSVLYGRKTTGLLRQQEKLAFNITRLWMDDYYLTYPETTVEDEVKENLKQESDFIQGPNPIGKDRANNLKNGFSLVDENYISARWPGDIYSFTANILKQLK
jgi:protease I